MYWLHIETTTSILSPPTPPEKEKKSDPGHRYTQHCNHPPTKKMAGSKIVDSLIEIQCERDR